MRLLVCLQANIAQRFSAILSTRDILNAKLLGALGSSCLGPAKVGLESIRGKDANVISACKVEDLSSVAAMPAPRALAQACMRMNSRMVKLVNQDVEFDDPLMWVHMCTLAALQCSGIET